MRAFVTGATGFIGTHVVLELARAGWEILALRRPSSDVSELDRCRAVRFVQGDITDVASLRKAVPEGIDAVFHVAGSVGAPPHGEEASRYAVNQLGTRNVVDVCLEKKIGRLIGTSTVLTYDFRVPQPFDESAPPNDFHRDPYIHSKRLADLEIEKGMAAGLDAVMLHPSATFGAYDKATWSKMFLEIQRGLPLPFAPPGGASVCHARPVARAHVAAFEHGARNRHYILGGPDVTWLRVAKEIAGLLGRPGPRFRLRTPLFQAYGWTEFAVSRWLRREPMLTPHTVDILAETVYSDSRRAVRELGYEPSSLQEMLVDCHQWMLASGMLSSTSGGRA